MITRFTPSPQGPFQFQADLDGLTYNVTVTWNVYAARWYVNVTDPIGNLIVSIPMIGSPPDVGISLVAGYFTSTMVFRQDAQVFEVLP